MAARTERPSPLHGKWVTWTMIAVFRDLFRNSLSLAQRISLVGVKFNK